MEKNKNSFELNIKNGRKIHKGMLEKIDLRLDSEYFSLRCNGVGSGKTHINHKEKIFDGFVQKVCLTVTEWAPMLDIGVLCLPPSDVVKKPVPFKGRKIPVLHMGEKLLMFMPKDYVSQINKNIKILMNAKKIKILCSSEREVSRSNKKKGYVAQTYSEVFADNKKVRFIERMVFEVDITDYDNPAYKLSFKFPNPKKIRTPDWGDSFVSLKRKGFSKIDMKKKERRNGRGKK